MSPARTRGTRRLVIRVLAAAMVLDLGAAVTSLAVRHGDSRPVVAAQVQGRALPAPMGLPDASARARAVADLLTTRAHAVLDRDRAAFLGTVDPAATVFASRQAALFDNLAQVPLAIWNYTLDPGRVQPPDPALDARYGTWWGPRVVLAVGLTGVDVDPAESTQALTFVQRAGSWYVAADDDFAMRGSSTGRELWDEGPVEVVRGAASLVLGHPGRTAELQRLAADLDAAVPRVTAVWGPDWAQQVAVVVPADQAELGRLVTARGSLAPIAALAVAGPVRGGTARGADRVLINPANLSQLSEVGRRVVLAHEVTHVASRSATGSATPTWLSEGLADHVGYSGQGVPLEVAAGELRDEVRAGRVPDALPTAADFSGDNPRLTVAYEQAWLAVELLVRTYGRARTLAFYRDVGGRVGQAPAAAVEQAMRAQLGTDPATFTAAWQADLRRQLA